MQVKWLLKKADVISWARSSETSSLLLCWFSSLTINSEEGNPILGGLANFSDDAWGRTGYQLLLCCSIIWVMLRTIKPSCQFVNQTLLKRKLRIDILHQVAIFIWLMKKKVSTYKYTSILCQWGDGLQCWKLYA